MEPDDLDELHELMEDYGLDAEEAIHVKEIMDEEGLDADEAVELKDEL
jgi:hypothetical protein